MNVMGFVVCFLSAGVYLQRGDAYGFIAFLFIGIVLSNRETKNAKRASGVGDGGEPPSNRPPTPSPTPPSFRKP
jgi:hypothetical protein